VNRERFTGRREFFYYSKFPSSGYHVRDTGNAIGNDKYITVIDNKEYNSHKQLAAMTLSISKEPVPQARDSFTLLTLRIL
jgi:hypothetical protein